MKNCAKWIKAIDETADHRSEVQGFVLNSNDNSSSKREGNHVLKDCAEPNEKVIWESGYDDGKKYDEYRDELNKQADLYRVGLIAKRFEELGGLS